MMVRLTWTAPPQQCGRARRSAPSRATGLSGHPAAGGTGRPATSRASATSTTVDGLQPGTTYYFAVTAVSAGGEGAKSNELPVPIPARRPDAGVRVNIQDYGAVPDDAGDDAPATCTPSVRSSRQGAARG